MRFKLSITLLLVFTLIGCKKHQLNDCFSSAGEDSEETRSLGSFDKIWVGDKLEVVLFQDTSGPEKMVIKGGENLFEGIVTTIENGELRIDNQNICNFVRSYKKKLVVEIYLKSLSRIEVATAANVRCNDTIVTPYLNILHHSMGDMNLNIIADEIFVQSLNGAGTIINGKVGVIKASVEGISFLDCRNCDCNSVFVDTHSPLDCFINANDIIFVKIYNSGNIYYVKEPSTQKEVNEKTGEGELLLLQ